MTVILGRSGSWTGNSGGGVGLTLGRVWLYQDFAAGSGPGLTITGNDNGSGITFSAANIVNSSAVVTKTNGNPIYNSTTEIPANLVSVSVHAAAAVTLDGTPAAGEGTIRIWYLYSFQSTDLPTGMEIAPQFVTSARTVYLDAQYLNAGLNLSDLSNAATARLNLGFTAQTAGQVLYGDGSTTFTSEAAFFYDSSNNRLGIGTNTPTTALDVVGVGTFSTSVVAPAVYAANIYGGTTASGNLTLNSTSDATKGFVNIPDITNINSPTVNTGALNLRARSDSLGQHVVFQSPDGASNLYFNYRDNKDMFLYDASGNMTWSYSYATRSFTVGQAGGDWHLQSDYGDPDTSLATPGRYSAVGITNTDTTDGNYGILAFVGSQGGLNPDSAIYGVHDDHNGASSSGSLEFWTRNAGTYARRQRIGIDGQVTMDAYGAGIAHFSSDGLISSSSIANADMATMATMTIKGNNTGGASVPIDLTATQVTAMLDAFVGDSGAGGTKGLVPAPAAGDAAALKFLKADGTWAVTSAAKAGSITLSISTTTKAVAFATARANANYSINWAFKNTTDSTPAQRAWNVIAQSTTGFTIEWNDALDTANYVGLWSILEHYDP